jgi:hypothetical protein
MAEPRWHEIVKWVCVAVVAGIAVAHDHPGIAIFALFVGCMA